MDNIFDQIGLVQKFPNRVKSFLDFEEKYLSKGQCRTKSNRRSREMSWLRLFSMQNNRNSVLESISCFQNR